MRRVLIDSARRKNALKRGGGAHHTQGDDSKIAMEAPGDERLAPDESLARLEKKDSSLADIVTLRYFSGLTIPEAAAVLETSPRDISRKWEAARAWLLNDLNDPGDSGAGSEPEKLDGERRDLFQSW